MAAINVTCPNCSQTLRVTDRFIGVRVRCKFCQRSILIEVQENPPAHDPAIETMDLPLEENVFEQQTIAPGPPPRGAPPPRAGSPGVFEQQTIGPVPPHPVAPAPGWGGGPGVFEQQTVAPGTPPWLAPPPHPAGNPGVFEQQTAAGYAAAPPGLAAGMWYYERAGAPAGPVPEHDLRYLIKTEMIGADDRVWTAGMPAWQTAAAVLPRSFPDAAAGPGWPFLRVLALILSTVATASVVLLVVVISRGRPVAVAKADPIPPADTPAPTPPPPPPPPVTTKVKENTLPVKVEPPQKSPPVFKPELKTPVPVEPMGKPPVPPVIPNVPMTKPPEPMAVAPPVVPKLPPLPLPPAPMSWASDWADAGNVRVRVAGVVVTKVPLEIRKRKMPSPKEYFVVWVEVQNTAKEDLTYNRWQPVLTGECTLWYKTGGVVFHATYPPDADREWFTKFTRPLPVGGPPLLEALAFERPKSDNAGPLTLTLDATRAGGAGRVTLQIPHAVWAPLGARAPDDRPDAARPAVTQLPPTHPGRAAAGPVASRRVDRLATSAGVADPATWSAGIGGAP